jgi:hypothetical protein
MTTEATPAQTPAEAGPKRGAGHLLGLVVAGGMALVGVLLLIGGLAVIGAHAFVRDDDGFYTTDTERLETDDAALVTEDIDLSERAADWAPDELLGDLRFRAESSGGAPVFVGIARTADVERYLDGIAHAKVTNFENNPGYDDQPGTARAPRPSAEAFWASQSQGTGEQTVEWKAENGNWTAVAMNPDGRPVIAIEADAGVQIGWLIWLGLGLTLLGLAVTAAGVAVVVMLRRRSATEAPRT